MKKYYEQDLRLMSVYQLQEIARREKIIPAVANRLNRELLIQTILTYRSAERALLINEFDETNYQRLEKVVSETIFQEQPANFTASAGITVWQGLAVNFYDNITINYVPSLAGTNAFIIDSEKNLCCVFNVTEKIGDKNFLYLRKEREFPCRESKVKSYNLILLERNYSEQFFHFYRGETNIVQKNIPAYRLQLLDFKVEIPKELKLPCAIDFGSSTTTAGVLDYRGKNPQAEFNSQQIRHAVFYNLEGREVNLIPTIIAVKSLKNPDKPEFVFGFDAWAQSQYHSENIAVMYDVKRWTADSESEEELVDSEGRRIFMVRKKILREFFLYIIKSLEDYVKGKIKYVHISSPVKQKRKFQDLFREILPEYAVEQKDMIDESVAVLYNTISELIENKTIRDRQKYSALVIDCGGGTTDVSSCTFKVENRRVSYSIEIETGYENGNTDFGGNNLTYRILQMLKLKIIEALIHKHSNLNNLEISRREFYGERATFDEQTLLKAKAIPTLKNLLKNFHLDVYRFIDENDVNSIYKNFEDAYNLAEEILPTKFKLWETVDRQEYFRVRNNYYFLVLMSERVKRAFFRNYGVLKIFLSAEGNHDLPGRNWAIGRQFSESQEDSISIALDKWKISIKNSNDLVYVNDLPDISFNIFEIEPILNPDIYNIIQQLFEPIYESGELENYNIIKLSGQSCKINLFKTSMKEFVPGKLIKSKPKVGNYSSTNELKMSCIDGALKYLRDKKFGYADIKIKNRPPQLPYLVTAFTHSGREITLIDGSKKIFRGVISRNIEDLTLTVFLKDGNKNLRQEIFYECTLDEFEKMTQADIDKLYGDDIPQAETDIIVNGEIKFFVRIEPQDWGFIVVPVYRNDETLFVGWEKFFSFENDDWINNFFDGMK